MLDSLMRKIFPTAWRPAKEPDGYQFDLDGSLRFNRFATGIDFFPTVGGDGTVPQIGMVSGFMMQRDVSVWAQAVGRKPSGPMATTQPINLQWQVTVPGLTKSY